MDLSHFVVGTWTGARVLQRSTVMAVTSAAHSAAPRSRMDITPLMLASRAVAAAMVRSLESVDASVSVTHMRVLVLLSTGEPLNLTAVAEGLGVNASNASRTCRPARLGRTRRPR